MDLLVQNPTLNANAQPKDTKLLVKAITGLLRATSFTLKPKNFFNNYESYSLFFDNTKSHN